MEERSKEEGNGGKLRKQEEGRLEAEAKEAEDEEEEKGERNQNLPLSQDFGQEFDHVETASNQENPLDESCPALEDGIVECDLVKEELAVDVGHDGGMVENAIEGELIVSERVMDIDLCEGMEFESEEAARVFYNGYAQRVGFNIRASDFYRSKRTGEITSRRFVCARQGFHKRKDELKHPRTSNREGCKAFMHVKRRDSGRWVVVKAVKGHNHDLMSVKNLHNFQSKKHLYDAAKSLIYSFESVEKASSYSIPGSREISSGRKQKCDNYIGSDHQRNLAKDMQCLLEYFKHKQAANPAFFYSIQVDEGQCMRNVFWVDPMSRLGYKYFSDVITFDVTCKRSQFPLSFASFTGLNHHEQTTLFGSALLSDESESSFIWLFNTWLAAMSGRHPKAIVTSQDKSIQSAVAQVLLKTHHSFSMWHILSEVRKKLAHVYKGHQSFEGELHECIHMNGTVEEFESNWELLLSKYNLKGNGWMQWLYDVRRQWIPLYLRDTFFAEMSAAWQNGSLNSVFNQYVSAQAPLQEFIKQSEKALDRQYEREVEADFETIHTKPSLKTTSPMERQAAHIYTKKIFTKFQEELFETNAYTAHRYKEDGAVHVYRVAKFGEDKKAYTVAFNTSKLQASCNCRMFEFSGILCRHVLTVFRVANILTLPSHCILKRWTRNAKSGTVLDDQIINLERDCCNSLTLRYNNLCQEAIRVAEEGAVSMDIYDVAIHALRAALDKVIAAKNIAVNVMVQDSLICGDFREGDICEGSQVENVVHHTSYFSQVSEAQRSQMTSTLQPGWENNTQKIKICNT